MKIKILITCFLLVTASLLASSLNLSWNPPLYESPDYYTIYYGFGGAFATSKIVSVFEETLTNTILNYQTNLYYGVYNNNLQVSGDETNATVTNLVNGATYFFAMTSSTIWGESDYTPEISFTTPSYPTYTNGGRLPTLTLQPNQFKITDDLFITTNWVVLGNTNLLTTNWQVVAKGSNSFVNCVVTNNNAQMFFRLQIN